MNILFQHIAFNTQCIYTSRTDPENYYGGGGNLCSQHVYIHIIYGKIGVPPPPPPHTHCALDLVVYSFSLGWVQQSLTHSNPIYTLEN